MKLAPAEQQIGTIGKEYETTAKTIDGWKVKEAPKNAKGTYQAEEQTITYVYLKAAPAEETTNEDGGQAPSGNGGTTTGTPKTLPHTGQSQASAKKLPATGEKRTGSLVLSLIGLGIIGTIGMSVLRKKV